MRELETGLHLETRGLSQGRKFFMFTFQRMQPGPSKASCNRVTSGASRSTALHWTRPHLLSHQWQTSRTMDRPQPRPQPEPGVDV